MGRTLKIKTVFKSILFCVLFLCLFYVINKTVKPIWTEWNNFGSLYGFYDEPQDTIDTVFLGPSLVANGIIPIELYDKYGICSYALGTDTQPMISSYYWLKEVYRLHDDSLKTVVLDVSCLRHDSEEAFFLKSIIPMKNQWYKMNAFYEYYDDLECAVKEMIPILRYHSRWKELSFNDFNKSTNRIQKYFRGYHYDLTRYPELGYYEANYAHVPIYSLKGSVEEEKFDDDSIYYCKKIIQFCQERNIDLVFIRIPVPTWEQGHIKATQELADCYGIPYYDLDLIPYIDKINYNGILDTTDSWHLNYYGAKKVTNIIGGILYERGLCKSVKGNIKYEFLEKELDEYNNEIVTTVTLKNITDPCEYINMARGLDNCMVFIAVYDDATSSFDNSNRKSFEQLGLEKLSTLQLGNSYVAAIIDGNIVFENSKVDIKKESDSDGSSSEIEKNDSEKNEIDKEHYLIFSGEYSGIKYKISSGGNSSGIDASVIIDGVNYSTSCRGLNIVVYDYQNRKLIDSTSFDTSQNFCRVTNLQVELDQRLNNGLFSLDRGTDLFKLYSYNRMCFDYRFIACNNLDEYNGLYKLIETFKDKQDYTIILTAMGEASGALDEKARDYFSVVGLEELSKISFQDSYIGIIDSGKIMYDKTDHNNVPLEYQTPGYYIKSGGAESGNTVSTKIHNCEQISFPGQGLNVTVYDNVLERQVISKCFDTSKNPVLIGD